MKIAFFDLETTGLPETISYNDYHPYNDTKRYNGSRIIQIAIIIQTDGKITKEHNIIIKPDEFHIFNADMHGIDEKKAIAEGIPFEKAIETIIEDLKTSQLLVAHNIIFDYNVLLAELYRYRLLDEIKVVKSLPQFCTSMNCRGITKLPLAFKRKKLNNIDDKYKQPKLSELYKFLFKQDAVGLHDALQDTRILASCFNELLKRQHFVFDK